MSFVLPTYPVSITYPPEPPPGCRLVHPGELLCLLPPCRDLHLFVLDPRGRYQARADRALEHRSKLFIPGVWNPLINGRLQLLESWANHTAETLQDRINWFHTEYGSDLYIWLATPSHP